MIQPLDRSLIESGARALRQGLLVAFPTETVYGLGADAESLIALKRLYEVKGRPDNHPVIVHIHCLDQLDDYAEHVQAGARALADRFWPGPLTLILPKSNRVPMQVTGGQNTVGLRIPNHPVALALLKAFGGGVAAPSANRFGRISPTTAKDVSTEFGSDLVFVLEGGVCQVGIESTIVDFSGDVPRLLRPGMILPQDIRDVVGRLAVGPSSVSRSQTRAPGGLSSHYAPRTPLELVGSDKLVETIGDLSAQGQSCAVLFFKRCADFDFSGVPGDLAKLCANWLVAPTEPAEYAQTLYSNLRELDRAGSQRILVEMPPLDPGWIAIHDRLSRAAVAHTVHEITNER